MKKDRTSAVERATGETCVKVSLDLDGAGESTIATGVGFFDHMLAAVARHGLFDLNVSASGDLHVDDHHTVEDVGIALGQAFAGALGSGAGIRRMGSAAVPMDEALVLCAIDVSGRGSLECDLKLQTPQLGAFTTELAPEFFRAVALHAGWTIHIRQLSGGNTHHVLEAAFKAFARAAREAVERDARVKGVPSTKGVL